MDTITVKINLFYAILKIGDGLLNTARENNDGGRGRRFFRTVFFQKATDRGEVAGRQGTVKNKKNNQGRA